MVTLTYAGGDAGWTQRVEADNAVKATRKAFFDFKVEYPHSDGRIVAVHAKEVA